MSRLSTTWVVIGRLAGGSILGLVFVAVVEMLTSFNIWQILRENPTARRALGASVGALVLLFCASRAGRPEISGKSPMREDNAMTPEQKKLLAEAGKLEKESLPPTWYFRWGPLVSGFAGLVEVLGLGSNLYF